MHREVGHQRRPQGHPQEHPEGSEEGGLPQHQSQQAAVTEAQGEEDTELAPAFQHRHEEGVEDAEGDDQHEDEVHEPAGGEVHLDGLLHPRLDVLPGEHGQGRIGRQQGTRPAHQFGKGIQRGLAENQSVHPVGHGEQVLEGGQGHLRQAAVQLPGAALEDPDDGEDGSHHRAVAGAAEDGHLVARGETQVARQGGPQHHFFPRP